MAVNAPNAVQYVIRNMIIKLIAANAQDAVRTWETFTTGRPTARNVLYAVPQGQTTIPGQKTVKNAQNAGQ